MGRTFDDAEDCDLAEVYDLRGRAEGHARLAVEILADLDLAELPHEVLVAVDAGLSLSAG